MYDHRNALPPRRLCIFAQGFTVNSNHARIAARLSASAIARAATSNAVTIAVGRRWGARTSTRTIRGGKYGMGKWPGEDDCERLGFFVNGDPDFPDLNWLFTDCVWDADAQRWERKQMA